MKRFIIKICVTLCLCVLVANALSGKDKIKIICSPLGGYPRILNC
jgi:hypothetical protein